MGRVSLRELSRRTGLDDHTVKACVIKAGLKHGQGGYDDDEALQACRDHADLLRVAGHDVARGDISPNDTAREQLAKAKAYTVELQNERLRLENEVRRGQLVEREAVEAVGLDLITQVKSALLALKYKLAPLVAVETDQATISKIIDTEVLTALRELSDPDRFNDAILNG
jgi:hypothetical protein